MTCGGEAIVQLRAHEVDRQVGVIEDVDNSRLRSKAVVGRNDNDMFVALDSLGRQASEVGREILLVALQETTSMEPNDDSMGLGRT
jgi:hypothetical protein